MKLIDSNNKTIELSGTGITLGEDASADKVFATDGSILDTSSISPSGVLTLDDDSNLQKDGTNITTAILNGELDTNALKVNTNKLFYTSDTDTFGSLANTLTLGNRQYTQYITLNSSKSIGLNASESLSLYTLGSLTLTSDHLKITNSAYTNTISNITLSNTAGTTKILSQYVYIGNEEENANINAVYVYGDEYWNKATELHFSGDATFNKLITATKGIEVSPLTYGPTGITCSTNDNIYLDLLSQKLSFASDAYLNASMLKLGNFQMVGTYGLLYTPSKANGFLLTADGLKFIDSSNATLVNYANDGITLSNSASLNLNNSSISEIVPVESGTAFAAPGFPTYTLNNGEITTTYISEATSDTITRCTTTISELLAVIAKLQSRIEALEAKVNA